MEIVSVINYKGGVGKTTVTANLAAYLALQGKKVLLLDMDPQASLTFSFVTPDYWSEKLEKESTIKQWFDCIIAGKEKIRPISDIIFEPNVINQILRRNNAGSISLIASHLDLINIDLELATLLGGASMSQIKKQHIKVHGNIRTALKGISNSLYDIILIDCPPNFNIVTKNALIASDQILVPAKPDYLSTLGIDYLQRSVSELINEYNKCLEGLVNDSSIQPKFLGVVFTMIQLHNNGPIRAQQQFIEQTKRADIPVFDNYIVSNNSIFADAPQEGIPVVMNDYSNISHANNVVQLKEIGKEFMSKMGMK